MAQGFSTGSEMPDLCTGKCPLVLERHEKKKKKGILRMLTKMNRIYVTMANLSMPLSTITVPWQKMCRNLSSSRNWTNAS